MSNPLSPRSAVYAANQHHHHQQHQQQHQQQQQHGHHLPAEQHLHQKSSLEEMRSSFLRLRDSADHAKHMVEKSQTLAGGKERNIVMILTKQVEMAHEELAKKENDLRIASQLGEQLLDKLDDTMQSLQELEHQSVEDHEEFEKVKEQKRKAEKEAKKFSNLLEEYKLGNEIAEEEARKLKEQLEAERSFFFFFFFFFF